MSCSPPNPPNLWSRATISCVNIDNDELAMRRKAEILKYKGSQNSLTKKQQWSKIVNGNGPLKKKVWAAQNDLGSNLNIYKLPRVGNTLILCSNNDNSIKHYSSSASNVPGNSELYYDKNIPLVNYTNPQRIYNISGIKWP